MLKTVFKSQTLLYIFALIATLMLSTVFTIGGVSSFFQISAGEATNFNDTLFNGFTSVRLLATLGYFAVWVAFLVWLLRKPFPHHFQFNQLLRLAAPFLLLAWIAYPLSSDVYLYMQYGLMGLRGVNPYLTAAGDISTVISPFLYWRQTSTYGPISEAIFMLSALFASISPMLAVYVFKIFCLLAHIINAYLIWRLLKSSPYRTWLTAAYLLNPFLLLAHVSDAHVDVFLCCSIIVLVGCLYYRFYVAAVLAVVAGFLTKTLPIIWFPLVIGFLVQQRRWKALAVALLACMAIFLVLSQTLFPSLLAWQSLLNPGVTGRTARSIHHLINLMVAFVTGSELSEQGAIVQLLSRLSLLGFALFYGWKVSRLFLKRNYASTHLVVDLGWVTLVLLLGATPWLMSWYPSVLLPFAALSVNAPVFSLASFVFSMTAGAVIGAGSGDTPLSIAGCFTTLFPALAVLLLRNQAKQIYQSILPNLDKSVVLPSRSSIDPQF